MFVLLFRWRVQIRKALSPEKANASTAKEVENEENKEDDEDKILNEMEELTYAMERKKKRTKKLLSKRRAQVCSVLFSLFPCACMITHCFC